MEKQHFVVGFVRGSHGVKGECKVESASGAYEHLLKLKEVTLRQGEQLKEVKVESASLGNNTLYLKFAGIDSPEAIQKYSKWEILAERKYCKPLKKDEWYVEDLRNCSLIYDGNDDPATLDAPIEIVGTITDVLEGGAGNLLEVLLSENCKCISGELKFTVNSKTGEKSVRTVLIPFNKEFIGKVDVKNSTVQLMHLWILE